MSQNLRDQGRLFDAGNDQQLAPAMRAGLDIDGEHSLEALSP